MTERGKKKHIIHLFCFAFFFLWNELDFIQQTNKMQQAANYTIIKTKPN